MKKILVVVAAIIAVATAAVWFAAEESYVTTVDARVGTALNVSAHGSQDFGLVFPQENRKGSMFVAINQKAKDDGNLAGVQYVVGCQSTLGSSASAAKAAGITSSSICEFLTSNEIGNEHKLVVGENQEQAIQWIFVAPDCQGAAQKKPDSAVRIGCSQDQNWVFSGEVFIDVTGYQGQIKEFVCNKKTGTFWNQLNDTGIDCTVGGGPQGPTLDELVDCDGIASRFAGCSNANIELKKGSALTSWATSPGFQGDEGIDIFDRDSSDSWTDGDDIHLEDEDGTCTTGNRGSGVHDFDPDGTGFVDCLVLDLNNDLHDKNQLPVDCDLESGTFCGGGSLLSDLKFFDANDNGVYDNGEDIVRDFNGDKIFN